MPCCGRCHPRSWRPLSSEGKPGRGAGMATCPGSGIPAEMTPKRWRDCACWIGRTVMLRLVLPVFFTFCWNAFAPIFSDKDLLLCFLTCSQKRWHKSSNQNYRIHVLWSMVLSPWLSLQNSCFTNSCMPRSLWHLETKLEECTGKRDALGMIKSAKTVKSKALNPMIGKITNCKAQWLAARTVEHRLINKIPGPGPRDFPVWKHVTFIEWSIRNTQTTNPNQQLSNLNQKRLCKIVDSPHKSPAAASIN